jgi:HD-GYP domain-containing protein (c-di-GMP phosphodiesterase class II)/phosphoribosyl 1,2-cyclic phosphodiesterase
MKIEVLGSYGNRDREKHTTCFKIGNSILIDAGNIIEGVENLQTIKHIFLTHSHLDHIIDIPFFIDKIYSNNEKTINIYGHKDTIKDLSNYIFNNKIWPAFQNINIIKKNEKTINFIEIKENKPIIVDNIEIIPFLADHTVTTFGYIINKKFLISGDTKLCKKLTQTINKYKPPYLLVECSFPNKLQTVANVSKHMTPQDIKTLINSINYIPKQIFIYHIKPPFKKEIEKELKDLNVKIVDDNTLINQNQLIRRKNIKEILFEMIKELYSENNPINILEKVVTYARQLTNSDGGTIYTKTEDDKYLEFKIIQNETLNINQKANTTWPKLPLYIEGKENKEMVASLCALTGKIINIEDVYNAKEFNFEGTRKFDKNNNYRSKSMLVIPLRNHENEIIGVLQLINKKRDSNIIAYDKNDEKIISLLASIAAISITKNKLIEDFEKLLGSLIKTIGIAIDEKSKYTSKHVQNVAKLALMIAKAIQQEGVKQYTKDELKMIEIAGWVHDIGKIAIPEYVMDKATKLEKLIDRIELIKYKFELLKKEYYIQYLEKKLTKEKYEELIKKADKDFEFLKELNKGYEWVSDEKLERVKEIAKIKIGNEPLINEDELKNLFIRKGTLTDEEREIIQSHAAIGLKMLQNLHFPKKYKRLPDIAGNHHEKLNGTGYPRGLTAKDLSLEERIMTIADIFEALSAADRPYKEPKKLSEIFEILYLMAKNNEIDKNIIKVIIKDKIYLDYAKKELLPEQIDEIPRKIIEYFLALTK